MFIVTAVETSNPKRQKLLTDSPENHLEKIISLEQSENNILNNYICLFFEYIFLWIPGRERALGVTLPLV
jgi:hypothetical protein